MKAPRYRDTVTNTDLQRVLAIETARTELLYAELQQAAAPHDPARRQAVHEAQRRVVALMAERLGVRR